MFGLGAEFPYFQCGQCGTVQIVEPPPDMSAFYPSSYYSLSQGPSSSINFLSKTWHFVLDRFVYSPSFAGRGRWPTLLRRLELSSRELEAVGRHAPALSSRILDVGSGGGKLLQALEAQGYSNLVGLDPYLPQDRSLGRVVLRRGTIDGLDASERFDVVIMHHSLEHVDDPIGTLATVRAHLAEGGYAIIGVPIVNLAFGTYGVNWCQLDAPRHFVVFSVRGFEFASQRSGLKIFDRYFNSTSEQFRVSEMYALNVPLSQTSQAIPLAPLFRAFSPWSRSSRRRADDLNRTERGDQAVFYLRS
jgi:SAM-dependent methyltransferase